MEEYLEHDRKKVGRIELVSHRCVKTFPLGWLGKLFKAINTDGEHKLYLSENGNDITLDTTNYASVVQSLESDY